MKIKQSQSQDQKTQKRFSRKKKVSREKNIDTRAGYGPTENFFSGRV